jgi:hypothetical protein
MTATQTETTTRSRRTEMPTTSSGPAYPETIELSLKTPGRTLRELSRRVALGRRSPSPEDDGTTQNEEAVAADVPPPSPAPAAHQVVQRWNRPRGNVGRMIFASFSFVIAGMNDGVVGVRFLSNSLSNLFQR